MTSLEDWQQYQRLQDFLEGHSLADILTAAAGKAFDEATGLRAAGYPETAQKLEDLGEVLGCASIPEVGTKR